jgi:hypothetical protein
MLSKRNIEINEYENVIITDAEGKKIEFTSIPQKSIISVYASGDKVNLKLIVSTKIVSGIVEKISKKDISFHQTNRSYWFAHRW